MIGPATDTPTTGLWIHAPGNPCLRLKLRRHRGDERFRSQALKRRRSAAVLVAILPVWGCTWAGCGRGTEERIIPARVWATGPSYRVNSLELARAETSIFARGDGTIRLTSAVNEKIGFNLVIFAVDSAVSGVELRADDLAGTDGKISASAIRAYRPYPITVERYPNWFLRTQGLREPRAYPDALVPIPVNGVGASPGSIAAQPLVVLAGQSLALYVEIVIPPDARPGRYKTAISLVGPNCKPLRTPIEVLVRDVYLDSKVSIPVVAGVQLGPVIASFTDIDPQNKSVAISKPECRKAIEKTFALLSEHGLSPYCDEIYPRFSQDVDGNTVLDWSEYDAFCGPFIEGGGNAEGRGAFAWPLPVGMSQPHPSQFDGMDSAAYMLVLQDYLSKARAHFEEKGWLERAVVYFDYPSVIDPNESELQRVRRLIEWVHDAGIELPYMSKLIPQPMTPFGWTAYHYVDLTRVVDIWATPARYQDAATLAELQRLGKRTWLLPDRPPYCGSLAVEAPPTHARSIAWQAYLQGHEAIWLPRATDWPGKVLDEAISQDDQASDAWLVYPGKLFGCDGPVPSARLKLLQAGIQDYQCLRLLSEHGHAATAGLLARSLIKACGTGAYGDNFQDAHWDRRIDDPDVWDLAAAILREEAELAVSEHPAEPISLEKNRADWLRFLAATRSLEVWVGSARLRKDPRPGQTGYLATIDAEVRSELRTSVEGRLKFGPLAEGASAIDDDKQIGPLEEMSVASRSLTARFPEAPLCDLDGHYIQSIVFDAGRSGLVEAQATFSISRVSEVSKPPRIDGSLDDWPPGTQNVMGDFRLIAFTHGSARRRAESQTIGYCCTDGSKLYLGIQALSPAGPTVSNVESNIVTYEDLRPVGSDLVEIMIDPTGVATQSDDIYHVVVKSTGNPIFERGVSVSPPIGSVAPWPGPRPEYSVTRGADGWTAEIAMSLECFGPRESRNLVWGFNLARLEPVRGEYSDWARAQRYCYDPASFGNLIWPDGGVGE